MSRLCFSSFHRLLADIYSHPLDVGLAFKQLSVTRPSERPTLDQPIFNWLSGPANGRPADRIGWGHVVHELDIPSKTSISSTVGGYNLAGLVWSGWLEKTRLARFVDPPHTNGG